jgi:hypothetical protein
LMLWGIVVQLMNINTTLQKFYYKLLEFEAEKENER